MYWFAVAAVFAVGWYGLPYAIKRAQIYRLREECRRRKAIVLTFDDGPNEHRTAQLLDLLRARGALASFFLMGQKIDAVRPVATRIALEGHDIGSHSFRHLHAWTRNPFSVYADIRSGLAAARSIAPCRLFRAPYGKATLATMLQVMGEGCRQAWWTIDSTDSWDAPRDVEHLRDRVRRDGGGVVLLHDFDRGQDESPTLEMTRALLDLAEEEGMRICSFGEVLNMKPEQARTS